ncbi:MAG: 3-dehydroquinate synthase [Candidatus Omnitrophica bacterium]|nr:3-dehydroquinate synthase [Candidatus Omnitrophota bacterium]
MQTIKVNLKNRSYNIVVGSNIISRLGSYILKAGIGRDAYIITNSPIKKRYGRSLEQALKKYGLSVKFKVVADTEKSKSVETSSRVIRDLAHYDRKKKIFIIAFGGGVVGDLSGFIAAIYKRGIPYIQVPTTLLAQVDSAIGGKTAVDLTEGKNLIGAFYQPRLVYSDIKFLKSLDLRQLRAGLAEVIKYGIIRDPGLLTYLETKYKDILERKETNLTHIVGCCSAIKADIVSRDEREEKGMRTILNFGHTIAHAIEAAAGYNAYNHGEAVSLGMLAATDISRSLGLIGASTQERIESMVRRIGLPVKIRNLSVGSIINAHYHDKKFIGTKNRFVLIAGIGKAKVVNDIPLALIKKSVSAIAG